MNVTLQNVMVMHHALIFDEKKTIMSNYSIMFDTNNNEGVEWNIILLGSISSRRKKRKLQKKDILNMQT